MFELRNTVMRRVRSPVLAQPSQAVLRPSGIISHKVVESLRQPFPVKVNMGAPSEFNRSM